METKGFEPSAIRRLKGNREHRPIPEEVKVEGGAVCPRWLSKRAKEHWKRLAPELREMGLLTKLDQGNFARYCQGKAALEKWERFIQEDGVMVTTPDGKKYIHPLIGAVNKRET